MILYDTIWYYIIRYWRVLFILLFCCLRYSWLIISIIFFPDDVGEREIDFFQNRDLDLILTERATRFYDPKLSGIEKEKCILVAVDTKLETRRTHVDSAPIFSLKESLRYDFFYCLCLTYLIFLFVFDICNLRCVLYLIICFWHRWLSVFNMFCRACTHYCE